MCPYPSLLSLALSPGPVSGWQEVSGSGWSLGQCSCCHHLYMCTWREVHTEQSTLVPLHLPSATSRTRPHSRRPRLMSRAASDLPQCHLPDICQTPTPTPYMMYMYKETSNGHTHTLTHYWEVRCLLTSAASETNRLSSSISSRVAHEAGRTPFPCSQCWNMDRQHDSTPLWPSSAWIRCRVSPDASKSSRSPISLHCEATVLTISVFCPSAVRITLS